MNPKTPFAQLVLALCMSALAASGCKPSQETTGGGGFSNTSSSSTTIGAGGQGGASNFHPGSLVDDGLVARYYLDEAASGQAPQEALDSAPDPTHLEMRYSSDTGGGGAGGMASAMAYTENENGNRGLFFPEKEMVGGAFIAADATKFTETLHSGTTLTYELVADIQAVSDSWSRLIHIGNGTDHTLSFGTQHLSFIRLTVNDTHPVHAPVALNAQGRAVYHVVLNTEETEPQLRAQFYANGSPLPTLSPSNALPQDTPIDLGTGKYFAIGNREQVDPDGTGRSIRGVIYYAAVYRVALSPKQILQNTAHLLQTDDRPQD